MRNEMSVKEIYEALDQLERLKQAYETQRIELLSLELAIEKFINNILTTAMTYQRVASASDTLGDKMEFLGKAAGLLEAITIIRDTLAVAEKGD